MVQEKKQSTVVEGEPLNGEGGFFDFFNTQERSKLHMARNKAGEGAGNMGDLGDGADSLIG